MGGRSVEQRGEGVEQEVDAHAARVDDPGAAQLGQLRGGRAQGGRRRVGGRGRRRGQCVAAVGSPDDDATMARLPTSCQRAAPQGRADGRAARAASAAGGGPRPAAGRAARQARRADGRRGGGGEHREGGALARVGERCRGQRRAAGQGVGERRVGAPALPRCPRRPPRPRRARAAPARGSPRSCRAPRAARRGPARRRPPPLSASSARAPSAASTAERIVSSRLVPVSASATGKTLMRSSSARAAFQHRDRRPRPREDQGWVEHGGHGGPAYLAPGGAKPPRREVR